MQDVDIQRSEISSVLARLLGRGVTSIEGIGGGRNSKVYKVDCGRSGQYAAKFYFRHNLDRRDRLDIEFSGLQFLWKSGIKSIPRPIAIDRDCGCAVYEYIDGNNISSQEVTNSDIDEAVEFLARLKEIGNRKGVRFPYLASEACFSIQAVVHNIEQRLNRLSAVRNDEAQYPALRGFLANEFIPSFDKITSWCRSGLGESGISFVSDLEDEERTLSPSDFGFHNALRRSDGQIVFLDFEYFGWDDPAKMISDFLLHPGMELCEDLKRRFVAAILNHFQDQRCLARRVEIVYPLFGLKWCLILLNEFVPEHLLRRGFASGSSLDRNDLQAEQLAKARQMLHGILRDHEHFPYRD